MSSAFIPHPPRFATGLKWIFTILEILIAGWTAICLIQISRISQAHGSFSFGGVGFKVDPKSYEVLAPALKAGSVSFGDLFGAVSFQAAEAPDLVKSLMWPLCGILFCRMALFIVLCDLFRRLFASLQKKEVYTRKNMALMRKVGWFLLLVALMEPALERVYGGRMVSFVKQNVTSQGALTIDWRLPPSTGVSSGIHYWNQFLFRVDEDAVWIGSVKGNLVRFDPRTILIGLLLIGLGSALGQGIALREENELTV